MVPVIRISHDTFKRLQVWAEPLKDNPDDVLRKLLDIAEKSGNNEYSSAYNSPPVITPEEREMKQQLTGRITSEREYYGPILEVLYDLGGSGPTAKVLELVEKRMQLHPSDYEMYESGNDIRWKNHVRFARKHMIDRGYLKDDSPRGVWELAQLGRKEVERNRK